MYKGCKKAVFSFFLESVRSLNEPGFFGVISSAAIFDGVCFLSGTSIPALWRVSTGRQERLTVGTALSALLLQSMLGATLHCTGQRWHGSGWGEMFYAFIQSPLILSVSLLQYLKWKWTFFEQNKRNVRTQFILRLISMYIPRLF